MTVFHSQDVYLRLFGEDGTSSSARKRFENGHVRYQCKCSSMAHFSYDINPLAVYPANDNRHLRFSDEPFQPCRNLSAELHRRQSRSLYIVQQRQRYLAVWTN